MMESSEKKKKKNVKSQIIGALKGRTWCGRTSTILPY